MLKNKHLDLCCPTMTNCFNYFCYNMHQYSVFIISLMPWRCLYILHPLAKKKSFLEKLELVSFVSNDFKPKYSDLIRVAFYSSFFLACLLFRWLLLSCVNTYGFFLLPSYKQLIRGNNDSSYCIKLLHKGRSIAST